jgi:hypothetical protein
VTTDPVTRHRDQPLIVAVEGLRYAGKSTLIAHLAPLVTAAAIAGYSDLPPAGRSRTRPRRVQPRRG